MQVLLPALINCTLAVWHLLPRLPRNSAPSRPSPAPNADTGLRPPHGECGNRCQPTKLRVPNKCSRVNAGPQPDPSTTETTGAQQQKQTLPGICKAFKLTRHVWSNVQRSAWLALRPLSVDDIADVATESHGGERNDEAGAELIWA